MPQVQEDWTRIAKAVIDVFVRFQVLLIAIAERNPIPCVFGMDAMSGPAHGYYAFGAEI